MVGVGALAWLWVAIAYVSWKVTERWGDPEGRLGLAARRYMLSEPATELDRRTATQPVKWAMRRELQRATGFPLHITGSEGAELADLVRHVLVDHVKGRFVRVTMPPSHQAEGRHSLTAREWAAVFAAAISAATALMKLFDS